MNVHRGRKTITLSFYKSITLKLYSQKRSKLLLVCERQRLIETWRQRQTAILTHAVLSSRPYICFSDETYSTGPAAIVLYLTTDHCKLALTDWDSHMGICIYHFIMPTISIQTCDCFHLFSQVHSEQRISDWWLSQGLICSITSQQPVFQVSGLFFFSPPKNPFPRKNRNCI